MKNPVKQFETVLDNNNVLTRDQLEDCLVYFEKKGTDFIFHLASIDPAIPLRAVFENVKSAVLFSATLTPADYYKRLLGGKESTQAVSLPSPFPKENRKVLIAPLRMTYQVRRNQIPAVCRLIYRMTEAKSGHYLVFFPSFAFLEEVVEAYTDLYPLENVMVQSREMDEEARIQFLHAMHNTKKAVTAFCVLGGVFSEGIDLVGEELIQRTLPVIIGECSTLGVLGLGISFEFGK